MTVFLQRISCRRCPFPISYAPAFATPCVLNWYGQSQTSRALHQFRHDTSTLYRTLQPSRNLATRPMTPTANIPPQAPKHAKKETHPPATKAPQGEQPKAAVDAIPKFLRRTSKGALSNVSTLKAVISWYPGHIAKAERTLKQSIKLVDVVIEVRDSRIPISTAHPSVPEWLGTRSHLLVLNRADLAPQAARSAWRAYFESRNEPVYFVNARQGRGVKELKKVAIAAGTSVNEKRKLKGLLPRPVRCLVIGYPNVGKSALINKLVGRNTAKSANKPGVTRNYQWIRISESIELLDMPGIIPAKFVSQDKALRLAICDDIGQAAYDDQIIAAMMMDEMTAMAKAHPSHVDLTIVKERFGIDPTAFSGEEFLHQVADHVCKGDVQRAAVRMLTEFRAGVFGPVALETPDMLITGNATMADAQVEEETQ